MGKEKTFFWKKILPYILPYRTLLIKSVFWSVALGLTQAVQPLIVQMIIDNGIANDSIDLSNKLVYVIVASALYIIIRLLCSFSWKMGLIDVYKADEAIMKKIRMDYFQHLGKMSMKQFNEYSAGELCNRIIGTGTVSIRSYLDNIFANVPSILISMLLLCPTLFQYDWLLTVIMVGTVALMVMSANYSRKKVRTETDKQLSFEIKASRYVNETMLGMLNIKLSGAENYLSKKIDYVLGDVKDSSINALISSTNANYKLQLINGIGCGVVYLIGGYSCLFRGMSVGILTAFLSSMTTVVAWAQAFSGYRYMQSSAEAGLGKIMEVINCDDEILNKETAGVENDVFHNIGDVCLQFKDVGFKYNDKSIFTHLDLIIKHGERVFVAGDSMTGKSTLSQLMVRLNDVNNGNIILNGKDIRDYPVEYIRHTVGIIPHATFIFNATIMENVLIGCETATVNDIVEALKTAGLESFIEELPQGIETYIDMHTISLTMLQKYKIALARVLIGKRSLLVFDDIFSGLEENDANEMKKIVSNLPDEYTIICTGNENIFPEFDKCYEITDGKVCLRTNGNSYGR